VVDFRRERDVIKQEILMSSEDAEDYIYELYYAQTFRGHEMARPILGSIRSLDQMTRARLLEFYHDLYHGKHLVVSVSGLVDHDEVCGQLERALTLQRRKRATTTRSRPTPKSFVKTETRDGDQVHILFGVPGPSLRDRDRFEAFVVNAALGGGMTSKLYQKIRESLGLSYSVYSTVHGFSDHGLMTVYLATAKKNVKTAVEAVIQEFRLLFEQGLSSDELNDYRTQVIGELLLDAEDLESRMLAIGTQELLYGTYRTPDEIAGDIQKVNVQSVRAYCKKFFASSKMGVVVFGDIAAGKTTAWIKRQLKGGKGAI